MRSVGVPLRGNDWSVLEGRDPATPPLVTVVVVHYEQQAELDRTLLALSRQTHPHERLEVVVVDDGSATPPRVPEGVRLIVQEPRGFRLAAARNLGAEAASGDVLCFVDADTAPEPDYVRALTRLPALAPDVVAVGRRRHADFAGVPLDAPVAEAAADRELPEPAWLVDAYRASSDLLDADDRSYRFVIGAVIACSTALFRQTGGFDETFDSYGGEDWEWAYRAWLCGAALAYVPAAVAWHDGPEWSGRGDARRERKNAEALRLARRIPLPGSGPRGVRGESADVAVTVPANAAPDSAAWFVALDSIQADLPLAALPDDPRDRDRVRIVVGVERPCRVRPGALLDALDRLDRERLGALEVLGDDGETLLRVTATRAAARAERWRRDDLFATAAERVPGIDAVDDAVDVEGYLGGWA